MFCKISQISLPNSDCDQEPNFLKLNSEWIDFAKSHYDSMLNDLTTVDRWLKLATLYVGMTKQTNVVSDEMKNFAETLNVDVSLEYLDKNHDCDKCKNSTKLLGLTLLTPDSLQIDDDEDPIEEKTHCSTTVYKTLEKIFKPFKKSLIDRMMDLSAMPEYTGLVSFKAFKSDSNTFHPQHQTTMKTSTVVLMGRTDFLSSLMDHQRSPSDEKKIINYAARHDLIRSAKFEDSPLVFSTTLSSLGDALIRWKEPQLELGMNLTQIQENAEKKKAWMRHIESIGNKRLNLALISKKVTFTNFEELSFSFLKRLNFFWFTKLHEKYAKMLLAILGDFFCKRLDVEQLDEFYMRTSNRSGDSTHYLPNDHMMHYVYECQLELHSRIEWYRKFEKIRFTFDLENLEERWKQSFLVDLRWFLMFWFKHKMLTTNMLTHEFFGDRYHEGFVTELELNWYQYYIKNISKSNLLITLTKTKLIEKLRPTDFKNLKSSSSDNPNEMFRKIQHQISMRGKADWMRFQMIGSLFGSILHKFTSDQSKYVLHHGSIESNQDWFDLANFPFIFYNGGRYHVFYNKIVFYVNDLPRDLEDQLTTVVANTINDDNIDKQRFSKRTMTSNSKENGKKIPKVLEKKFEKSDDSELEPWTNLTNTTTIENRTENFPILDDVSNQCLKKLSQQNQLDLHAYCDPDEDSMRLRFAESLKIDEKNSKFHDLSNEIKKLKSLKESGKIKINRRDDGDTLYDTVALWVLICLENAENQKNLANKILHSLKLACNNLVSKYKNTSNVNLYMNKEIQRVIQFSEKIEEYECKLT